MDLLCLFCSLPDPSGAKHGPGWDLCLDRALLPVTGRPEGTLAPRAPSPDV